MARKDVYHQVVMNALQKDGWSITDDPLLIVYGRHNLFVDLGAERPIGAEKDGRKIAIEIKSFVSSSPVYDLYLAVGQYIVYWDVITDQGFPHQLYLAIPQRTYDTIFNDDLGELVIRRQNIALIVFEEIKEEIVLWIS
jgi:XisH protein